MNDFAVGERVVIANRYGSSITHVARETKTQWIVRGASDGSERRFRKSDLIEVGCDSWHVISISKLTPEVERDMRKKKIIQAIELADLNKLSLEELLSIWEKLK